jgi:hypothetical protein
MCLPALVLPGSFDQSRAQGWPWPKARQDPFAQPRVQSTPKAKQQDTVAPARAHGAPLLAVVALGEQRITIYDATGKMLQAPISTGSTGYETPAGVFSIVQKKEMHESNLYEDGKMPFMQRITWTGIALHAGALPGYPASHGCVRMPLAFAERLFPLTDIGLRVIIVRDDIAPADIAHPNLFGSRRREAGLPGHNDAFQPGSPKYMALLKQQAAAKAAEAEAAARRAGDAKRIAARKAAEAAPATRALRLAEASNDKAQQALKTAENEAAAAAVPPDVTEPTPEQSKKAEAAKVKAERARARAGETQAQLGSAKAQEQARADAAARAADEAKAADAAKDAAADAATEAKRKTEPVSVFVSRKTQRFYIRQGYQPIYEGPISIRDVGEPIGSYVFTALNYLGNSLEVRWNVVSLYKNVGAAVQPAALGARSRNQGDPAPADIIGAKAALDRIVLPPEALERIPEVVLPGSSLIISDEGPSVETGKDTDFVVVMSGEPQGALKIRKREPLKNKDDDDWGWGNSGNRRSVTPFKGFPFFQ